MRIKAEACERRAEASWIADRSCGHPSWRAWGSPVLIERILRPDHSGLAMEDLTIGAQRAISSSMNLENSGASILSISMPSRSNLARASGKPKAFRTAWFKRSTIVGDKPGGADNENQVVATRSGKPSSANVGTSGKPGRRLLAVTAIGYTAPASTWAWAVVQVTEASLMWPPMRSNIAGLAPL